MIRFSKRRLTAAAFAAVCASALSTSSARAELLAYWTFDAGAAGPSTGGPFAADSGTNAAASFASTTAVGGTNPGTVSSPAGNGTARSFSSNGWDQGEYFQFTAPTTTFDDISVLFGQTGSNTGPKDWTLAYSTDGSTFTNFANYSTINDSWSAGTTKPTSQYFFDLSAVSAVENAALVTFRLINSSTTSINGGTVASGGTQRVDTVQINSGPVPEPTAFALLGVAALAALRRRQRQA